MNPKSTWRHAEFDEALRIVTRKGKRGAHIMNKKLTLWEDYENATHTNAKVGVTRRPKRAQPSLAKFSWDK